MAELKSLTRAPSNRRAARIYRRVVQVNGTISMFILKALDKWSVLVGWKAVYDNVYAKTQKEAEAIEAARRATIRTQPSGRAKDLPELYVNRAMRWFLIFTTPINRFWNMLAWDVPRDIRNRRVGHALVTLAALFSIAAIEEIIRTWRVPDEPEEAKKFALRVASRFADWTPIAGQQIGPALRGEWFADKGTNPLPFALAPHAPSKSWSMPSRAHHSAFAPRNERPAT